jgi:hypothetical protein
MKVLAAVVGLNQREFAFKAVPGAFLSYRHYSNGASASVGAPLSQRRNRPGAARLLEFCRHQSFAVASCSCDNRLRVMTLPRHHRFPSRNQVPPNGTLEAPLPPPVRGFFFSCFGLGRRTFSFLFRRGGPSCHAVEVALLDIRDAGKMRKRVKSCRQN